ncbi:MAG: hypothetical protein ACLQUZ_06805 [Rhizomicrobium sp.]
MKLRILRHELNARATVIIFHKSHTAIEKRLLDLFDRLTMTMWNIVRALDAQNGCRSDVSAVGQGFRRPAQ